MQWPGDLLDMCTVRATVYVFFSYLAFIHSPRRDFHLFGVYVGLCSYLTVCSSSEVCAAVFALPSMYDYDFRLAVTP